MCLMNWRKREGAPLGRPKHNETIITKWVLKRFIWLRYDLVNMLMNKRHSQNVRSFLTRWDTVSFSRRIVTIQPERVQLESVFAVAHSTASNMTGKQQTDQNDGPCSCTSTLYPAANKTSPIHRLSLRLPLATVFPSPSDLPGILFKKLR